MADIQFVPTADIADIHDTDVRSCDIQFRNFGGTVDFCGEIHTISCFQDNGLVKKTLNSPGEGKVLVIDGHAPASILAEFESRGVEVVVVED